MAKRWTAGDPVPEDARARAELFRLLHTGTPGDVEFYLAACAEVATVLELGCGSGRVALPLAASGREVVGLDRDEAQLALAAEGVGPEHGSRLRLVVGDMTDFSLGARFDRVLIPFTGLFAVGGADAVARCFSCVRRHLAPGGVLIFDTYAVDEEACAMGEPFDSGFGETGTLSWRGAEVRVFERNVTTGEPGRVDVSYLFEVAGGGDAAPRLPHLPHPPRLIEQSIRHHFLSWPALDALLEEAGFTEATARGGFDGRPFDEDSDHLVVVAS